MAVKSRRRSYQKQRRSRKLNKKGGANPPTLYVLYVKNSVKETEDYDIIYIADNEKNAGIMSNDIEGNIRGLTAQQIQDIESNVYIQKIIPNTFSSKPTISLAHIDVQKYKGQTIANAGDESPLYFTYLSNGIITSIYSDRQALKNEAPELDIKTINKNTMNWDAAIFE